MAQLYTITAPLRPGLTPPPGVVPSFDDPFTLSTYQTLTIAGCIITTTLMLIARMYTKWTIMKMLVWEDCKPCHAMFA